MSDANGRANDLRADTERPMMRFMTGLVAVLALLVLWGDASRLGAEESKPSAAVTQAIGWLPPDTETVIVSQRPFRMVRVAERVPTVEQVMPQLASDFILTLREGFLLETLKDQDVVLAVEGGRAFKAPMGLGVGLFEGCQILQFGEAAQEALRLAYRECVERCDSRDVVGGKAICVFKEKREADDWTLYIGRPLPTVLVCATDRKYLEQVLQRIAGQAVGRALPDDLPEWRHLNAKAPVWAIRHYPKQGAGRNQSAQSSESDPQGIGLVFQYEPGSKNAGRVRYLSASPKAVETATHHWHHPLERLDPQITLVAPGVVEISTALGEQEVGMFLLVLCVELGRMIAI